jgi:hypothetical protein
MFATLHSHIYTVLYWDALWQIKTQNGFLHGHFYNGEKTTILEYRGRFERSETAISIIDVMHP